MFLRYVCWFYSFELGCIRMDDLHICFPFSTCFPSQFHRKGQICSDFAEKSPFRSPIVQWPLEIPCFILFLCWSERLLGLYSIVNEADLETMNRSDMNRYFRRWFSKKMVSPPSHIQVLNQAQQKHREEVNQLMDEVRHSLWRWAWGMLQRHVHMGFP